MGKLKKALVLLGAASISATLLTTTTLVKVQAEESTTVEVEVKQEEYPAKVVTNLTKGGDVLFSAEEGNVGDIVTAIVKADVFFSIKSVTINGNSFAISNDGNYQFQLVEGENVFAVEFEIDNDKLEEIAALINGVKKEGLKSLFTIENLLNLITWTISTLFASGFFITLIKNKKLKAKTVDQVTELIEGIIKETGSKTIEEFLNNVMLKTLDTMLIKMDNVDECIRVLCRCFVLVQSNTPEDRLAIINELTKLNNSDEKLSNQIRTIVKEEQAAQAQAVIEREKAIQELKKANESLVVEEDNGDTYGQV